MTQPKALKTPKAPKASKKANKTTSQTTVEPPGSSTRHIFPFGKLPAELRELVYEEVFLRKRLRIRRAKIPEDHERSASRYKSTAHGIVDNKRGTKELAKPFLGRNGASILRLNRQTYNEAMPILYSKNTFQFPTNTSIVPFLTVIGTGAQLIRRVEITTVLHVIPSCAIITELARLESLQHATFTFDRSQASRSLGIELYIREMLRFLITSKSKAGLKDLHFRASTHWAAVQHGGSWMSQWSSAEAPAKIKKEVHKQLLQELGQAKAALDDARLSVQNIEKTNKQLWG